MNIDPDDKAELLQIQKDYRDKTRKAQQYNKFIDKHQAFVVVLPITFALGAFLCSIHFGVGGSNVTYTICKVLWILFAVFALAILIICCVRTSKKESLIKQAKQLKREAKLITNRYANYNSRPTLFDDDEIEPSRKGRSNAPIIITIIIIAIIAFAVWNNKISTEHADRERAIEVQQQENAVNRRQEQLNNIYNYTDTGINCRSYTIGSSVYTECD